MSKIKVNSIVNKNDDGAPELSKGAIIPAGQRFLVQGDVNIVGVVTASSFIGDGSGLILPSRVTITKQKAMALRLLLDPLPFRS